jgi:hypothetical protein
MKKLIARFKRFSDDNEGMEFIQVAIIILGVIIAAAGMYALYRTVAGALENMQVTIPNANIPSE